MAETMRNKMFDVILSLLIAVSLGISGWTIKAVVELQIAVADLRSNQFGKSSGLEVWKEIGDIRKEIATIPKETPPQWFVKSVDVMASDLKAQIHELDAKLQKHLDWEQTQKYQVQPPK